MGTPESKENLPLEGKVAIITGGGTGIGRAIALEFAGAGADVVITGRRLGPLEKVAAEVKDLGGRSLAVQTDISNKSEVESLATKTISEFDDIDVLVNNAAIYSRTPILETNEDEWDEIIAINLKGCYLCCQAISKEMIKRKKGAIINIASTGGISTCGGKSMSVYGIAKAGVIRMAKGLAWELGKYNIRINTIAPGPVKTEMLRHLLENAELLKQEESVRPLGRLVEPGEIATIALFLATEASRSMTGHTIIADSGQQA